jgi:broad specificity phosphatase PhoE
LPEEIGDRLSARGLGQARAAAGALEGLGVDRLLSSPMRRARETAEVIGEKLDLPVAVAPCVHELREESDYGRLSPGDQMLRRAVTRMAAHPDDPEYAGNGAESFNEIVDRVRRLKIELESGPQGQRTLIVTHGIFTRFFFFHSLLGESFGPATTSVFWNLRSRNCGLSVFEHGERRHPTDAETPSWTCVTWMARQWDLP